MYLEEEVYNSKEKREMILVEWKKKCFPQYSTQNSMYTHNFPVQTNPNVTCLIPLSFHCW